MLHILFATPVFLAGIGHQVTQSSTSFTNQSSIILASQPFMTVSHLKALNEYIKIQIVSGRTSIIDFSRIPEKISYIELSDPSRFVYTTNENIKQKATTVFLREIQPLNFDKLTKNSSPTLTIQTRNTINGQLNLYVFLISSSPGADYSGVRIVPEPKQNIKKKPLPKLPNLTPQQPLENPSEKELKSVLSYPHVYPDL